MVKLQQINISVTVKGALFSRTFIFPYYSYQITYFPMVLKLHILKHNNVLLILSAADQ